MNNIHMWNSAVHIYCMRVKQNELKKMKKKSHWTRDLNFK